LKEDFKALVVDKTESDFTVGIKNISLNDLLAGEVLIKVAYSSINYKDGLASIPGKLSGPTLLYQGST
jgi:NADPH:quinone reductase-like Zn-dependent oxidoreductase